MLNRLLYQQMVVAGFTPGGFAERLKTRVSRPSQ